MPDEHERKCAKALFCKPTHLMKIRDEIPSCTAPPKVPECSLVFRRLPMPDMVVSDDGKAGIDKRRDQLLVMSNAVDHAVRKLHDCLCLSLGGEEIPLDRNAMRGRRIGDRFLFQHRLTVLPPH